MRKSRYTDQQRFDMKVERQPSPGCWLWKGSTQTHKLSGISYGQLWDGKRAILAHRWSYGHYIGPVSAQDHVCHTCDNGLCVNPAHLFLGSKSANMRDMVQKGRHASAKMDAMSRQWARELRAKGFSAAAISKFFGVNPASLRKMFQGKTYKDDVA